LLTRGLITSDNVPEFPPFGGTTNMVMGLFCALVGTICINEIFHSVKTF